MRSQVFAHFGQKILQLTDFLGGTCLLVTQICKDLFRPPLYLRLIIEQTYFIGVNSIGLIAVTSISTGMVMTLQFGVGLEKFGGKLYVPKIVSLSIVRELGPVFTAVMIAARVGAGIASELGSMKVTQQIDAIRALGTSPIRRVVIPKVIACVIALPLLTVFANTLGVLGGLFVGVVELGLDPYFYYNKVISTIGIPDYLTGFFKAPFFALFIAIPSCYYGLNVKEGTRGVGVATTRAVVTSCILIFISDFFITKFFYIIEKWFT